MEFKKLNDSGIPVNVEWYFEEGDIDLMEAGEDFALLSEMEFKYISKQGE